MTVSSEGVAVVGKEREAHHDRFENRGSDDDDAAEADGGAVGIGVSICGGGGHWLLYR